MSRMLPGTELVKADQEYVLAAFTHRFTGQHKPAWTNKPWKDGRPYPLQFRDDADWLANTLFYVKRDGRLDRRRNYCQSRSTWPDNPELRHP